MIVINNMTKFKNSVKYEMIPFFPPNIAINKKSTRPKIVMTLTD